MTQPKLIHLEIDLEGRITRDDGRKVKAVVPFGTPVALRIGGYDEHGVNIVDIQQLVSRAPASANAYSANLNDPIVRAVVQYFRIVEWTDLLELTIDSKEKKPFYDGQRVRATLLGGVHLMRYTYSSEETDSPEILFEARADALHTLIAPEYKIRPQRANAYTVKIDNWKTTRRDLFSRSTIGVQFYRVGERDYARIVGEGK